MKRFYEQVEVIESDGGFAVALDGRPVKTPGRAGLVAPARDIAELVAAEWRAQGDQVDLQAMHANRFANTAIDQLKSNPAKAISEIAGFGAHDLVCYRAAGPEALVARQRDAWDAYVVWLKNWLQVDLKTTSGIVHIAQEEKTLDALRDRISSLDPFTLAAFHAQVSVAGSLVICLAVEQGFRSADQAWADANLEEAWSTEKWGADVEAVARLAGNKTLFMAAHQFIQAAKG